MDTNVKNLPSLPGVYLFKDTKNHILYIGKAKNLKNRISSYFQKTDWKTKAIVESAATIDHIITKNELEAMLLEAELIKSNQPKFNVLLKSGQPFLYLMISSPPRKLPEIKIVRNKKERGTYFGPFLEKAPARKVYNFLIKTFKLKLCKKKIENGCLDYHMGICAGTCKNDFDMDRYKQRLELAKLSLKQGHKKFLSHLKNEIVAQNKNLAFETSQELHGYYKAFESVFEAIDTTSEHAIKSMAKKDIWILTPNHKTLFLFSELKGAIKKKREFTLLFENKDDHLEYLISYYRGHSCANTILTNFAFPQEDKAPLEVFLKKWNRKQQTVSITFPTEGHFLNLINLAQIHADQEIVKQKTLPRALKQLLHLDIEPHTIDCFDISHKQGMFMVGSCVRFKDGQPDPQNFRHFKIQTVTQQDDYACLQEIVQRRYKNKSDLPDLLLIDGGKGQLSCITKILPHANVASLAKRALRRAQDERVFCRNIPEGKTLNLQTHAAQVLICLRDYAHHFAISYHRKLTKH